MEDYDWLDLHDARAGGTKQTELTPTTDINAAFDQVAALFETYPEPPTPPLKRGEKMTSQSKRSGKKGRTTK
jgi:hypothetical protein